MAQHFTEHRKDVSAQELQERLDEIVADIDVNPDTVYHVADDQGRRFVVMSHARYQTLRAAVSQRPLKKPSDPSETPRT